MTAGDAARANVLLKEDVACAVTGAGGYSPA